MNDNENVKGFSVNRVMNILKDLAKKGNIVSFSEQHYLINSPKPYVYVSFKIPFDQLEKEVD